MRIVLAKCTVNGVQKLLFLLAVCDGMGWDAWIGCMEGGGGVGKRKWGICHLLRRTFHSQRY